MLKASVTSFPSQAGRVILCCILLPLSSLVAIECIKCSQCSTVQDSLCITEPPKPIECPNLIFQYCLTVVETNLSGSLISYTRSCSPDFYASKCETINTEKLAATTDPSVRERSNQTRSQQPPILTYVPSLVSVCVKTCAEDGCNSRAATSSGSYQKGTSAAAPLRLEPIYYMLLEIVMLLVLIAA